MSPEERIWLRVHEALDDGLDPLEDPIVQEHLAAEPDFARDLADQLVALRQLKSSVSIDVKPLRRRVGFRLAAALAAVALLVVAFGLDWSRESEPVPPPVVSRPETAASPSAFLRYRVVAARHDPASTRRAELTGSMRRPPSFVARHETRFRPRSSIQRIDLNRPVPLSTRSTTR